MLTLIAQLSDLAHRQQAASELARFFGADDLLIFIADPELNLLLPAAGFRQSLPQGREWQRFLARCVEAGQQTGELPFEDRHTRVPVTGVASADGTVLVLVGASVAPERLADLTTLLPLLAAAFRGERAALTAEGQAAVARQALAKSSTLAEALDAARRELQSALQKARQAQQRSAFLAEASKLLAASLDYETTLHSVARLVVPAYADCFSIDVVEDDGAIRRLIGAPAEAPIPLASSLLVLQRDRVVRLPMSQDGEGGVPAEDLEFSALLEQGGASSGLWVPLLTRNQTLGALTLWRRDSAPHYSEDDRHLVEELARRVALAIENARLYREAQQAIASRDEFLSIAAHELKTPITAMLGYVQLLQRRAEKEGVRDTRSYRALATLVEQTRRLQRLSLSLLDISQIQLSRLRIELEPVDLVPLLTRLVEEQQAMLMRHSVQLSTPGEPLTVFGDELRLDQVFYNLLQNAIKYSPEGGAIEVELTRHASYAGVTISDCGIGIPPEALPQLFHRFYRASNARAQQSGGMGLGLYIVQEIVALHGGRVEVASRAGRGSSFRVLLPLYETPAVE